MDSITLSFSHNFTFAGTADELLEVVMAWRAELPGEPSPGYFPSYDVRTQEQTVNIDLWTTKYLDGRDERLHIGAARAKGIGLGNKATVIADRGHDLIKLIRNDDQRINDIGRVELPVVLMRYQDVQIPRPNWENRLDFYTVKAWQLHDDFFPPIVLSLKSDMAPITGWLQFPSVVQDECVILLNRLSSWKPRRVIQSLAQVPTIKIQPIVAALVLEDTLRYTEAYRAATDGLMSLVAQASHNLSINIYSAVRDSVLNAMAPLQAQIAQMAAEYGNSIHQLIKSIESYQVVANLDVDIASVTRNQEITISRRVDEDGIRAAVREELQTWGGQYENRLVMRVAAEFGLEKRTNDIATIGEISIQPPTPDEDGWNAVFDWFYRVPRWYCLTLKALARKVSCSESYLKRKHAEYKAEYGERPMH